jgi:Predicted membrane protein
MGAIRFLFSPHGRIDRLGMWIYGLVSVLVPLVEGAIFPAADTATMLGRAVSFVVYWPAAGAPVYAFAATVLDLTMLWVGLAITLKRLHDRGKSAGWLVLMWLTPYVAEYLALYRLGMITGSTSAPPVLPGWLLIVTMFLGMVSLWAFIELYLRRSEAGTNRFGPSPLIWHAPTKSAPAGPQEKVSGD